MNPIDYVIDSALVLLVLLQIREQRISRRMLLRPVIVMVVAVLIYLRGIPTAGNDLVVVGVLALVGGAIGVASGQTVRMRAGDAGQVLVRAGWASAVLWVLGMGSRFAFIVWTSHGGVHDLTRFSADHSITSTEAWTVALLAMAAAEVFGRTLVLSHRWQSRTGGAVATSLSA